VVGRIALRFIMEADSPQEGVSAVPGATGSGAGEIAFISWSPKNSTETRSRQR
jgi:hypothetical protein